MKQNETTRDLLIKHYQKYPKLQIQDVLKFIYQSALGCEHLVSSLEMATEGIRKEYADITQNIEDYIDVLDGEYSRVHLSYLSQGLTPETLGKLFCISSKTEPEGKSGIENRLAVAKELISEEKLPFTPDEFERATFEWKSLGYPPVHHSKTFRENYSPSYRVISNRYLRFLPLFSEIDKKLKSANTVVAIEGGSASGKTTLSELLKTVYDCTVLHMDDFFLRPEQRTKERYAEVGGNVDRERFLDEVLIPMSKNHPIDYRRFDCATMTVEPAVKLVPKKLTIIEGAYSMHPELADYYDLSVFLDITPSLQRDRIAKRNSPQMAERFFREWIPLEELYFSQMKVKERCDLCVSIRI